jgi:hypothetical protein
VLESDESTKFMFTKIADDASLFAQYILLTMIVPSVGQVSTVVLPVPVCLKP